MPNHRGMIADNGEHLRPVATVRPQVIEDRFKKFEKIMPKRIIGFNNDFPTTRRPLFAQTTKARGEATLPLLVVDGEIFGNHFGEFLLACFKSKNKISKDLKIIAVFSLQ